MAKKEGNRPKITLACTDCKRRNYNTVKNRVNDRDRIEFKKYCRWCRKHTLHRENALTRARPDATKAGPKGRPSC